MEENYDKLASAEEIDHQIKRIAEDIIKSHESSPLFVALLRGAAPFTNKLMFALAHLNPNFHPELDYMMVSTYGAGRKAGEPHIVTDVAPNTTVRGRSVIVLDDVLDKGITAQFVFDHLASRGAETIQLAVLCEKQTERISDITPDYCGFTFTDEWLIGMGLDDSSTITEGYRWLDEIWQVKP